MPGLRYLNVMLTVLAVVLTLNLWTAWMGGEGVASRAYAQGIPDAGAQRQQIVDQLKLLNQKAEQIKELLVSGKVRVTVTNAGQEE